MIGGRPNRALYFIGYVGDEALYLGNVFKIFFTLNSPTIQCTLLAVDIFTKNRFYNT